MTTAPHRLLGLFSLACLLVGSSTTALGKTHGPWKPIADVPAPTEPLNVLFAGPGMLVVASSDRLAHFSGGSWTITGREDLPALFERDKARVSLRGGLVRGPEEAYLFGTYQTSVSWDGAQWRVEHGGGRARPKATYEVVDCNGEIQANDGRRYLQRMDDGTWERLRDSRICSTAPKIKGPPDCWRHREKPTNRVILCGGETQVWDETAKVWRVFAEVSPWRRPHPLGGKAAMTPVPDPDHTRRIFRWQHGDLLLLAIDYKLFVWTGDAWRLDLEAPTTIGHIFGHEVPHILLGQTVWRR